MIRSREIALRCATAMDTNLLRHKWAADENKRELYGVSERQYQRHSVALIRQLDACQDDEARRILLGRSR